ncbi:MAG: hypothetical protein C4327_12540 [Meiothermus sp.]
MRNSPHNLFRAVESAIYSITAAIIALGTIILLGFTVVEGVQSIFRGQYTAVANGLLDRVLLALMLAEILYTLVQFTGDRIDRMRLVEPFLVIGLIAAVRRILIITAESAGRFSLYNPEFLAFLSELALLSLMILSIAWAIRLVRR